VAFVVLAGTGAWLLRGNDVQPAFSADLARLRSVDDLYTAPQIRQQSGYSLEATAFSRAALRRLRQHLPSLRSDVRMRLAAHPDQSPAREALARSLLASSGTGVRAPTLSRLRALWRRALAERDAAVAIRTLADLAEATAPNVVSGGRPPAPGRVRVAALVRRSAANSDPAVVRARARVARAAGVPADAAMRAAARRQHLRATTTEGRVLEAAGILEAAAASGLRPNAHVVDALTDAASQSDDPEAGVGRFRGVARGGTLVQRPRQPRSRLEARDG
jgi:hypothetical protein